MKSTLAIHKETVRAVEQLLNAKGNVTYRANFGREDEAVGAFATLDSCVFFEGTLLVDDALLPMVIDDVIPIQTMKLGKDGQLKTGNNYRLERYGRRFAADIEAGVVEYQELRDHPEKPGYELWIPVIRF